MRVITADLFPLRLPRRTPFRVAYATRTAARSLLLRLVADDGRTGWGEAAPHAEVSGERRTDVREALERVAAERLVGADPGDAEPLRAALARDLARLPSARCAAESALADLRAQAAGAPLWRALGGARPRVRASVTIGILDEAATVAAARARAAEGFRDLKLKVGLDPDGDAARVRAVRRAVGPDLRLFLDANQGYDAAGALAFARAVAPERIEFLEQPVAADDLAGLAAVARGSPVAIAADEAVTGAASLARVLAAAPVRLVNVKLQKCGGPGEAALLIRMAEEAGVPAMVGCMTETRVGISAGLAVALGLANVAYADLDGAFDLEADPVAAGGARLEAGEQAFADGRPGLGLALDASLLARHRDPDLEEET